MSMHGIATITFLCSSLSIRNILCDHQQTFLPHDEENRIRITVRRNYTLEDTFHKLRSGLSLSRHLKVTFVGEPAVDAGGPSRESFHILCRNYSEIRPHKQNY